MLQHNWISLGDKRTDREGLYYVVHLLPMLGGGEATALITTWFGESTNILNTKIIM